MHSVAEFMSAAPARLEGNSPWASRYASELRRVVTDHANGSARNLQRHLGPSELGVPCDRQVVGKLAGLPVTNHVVDPWPSIVGTAVHAWLADAFTAANLELPAPRWLAEQRVIPHPDHSGTADLYDAVETAVVDHKGVFVDTPIATPDGWTTMGQLSAGDTVFGADGQPCRVTRVYPVQQRPCYRIRFTDGSELLTDDVQQIPFVRPVGRRLEPVLMSVAAASVQVWSSGARPQRQLRVYNGAAIDLPERDLPVHPYVLGCWLGDGGVHGGQIAKPDDELFEHIAACGYDVSAPIGQRGLSRTVYGLSTQLQGLGLQWVDEEHRGPSHRRLAGEKRVPEQYLRASRGQRLALLQGLMDTDGTWNRARNQAVFTTTDKGLAEAVAELVMSLGWKVKVFPQKASGFGLTVTAYHVPFTPFGANPFRLSRKASLVRLAGTTQARYRLVESVEPTLSVPTRCIDVDSADHLYLCGPQFVPVHNCLGESSMAKVRSTTGPPVKYVIQLLLYGKGYRNLGLPVTRVALAAYPRTAASLDGLFVWERATGPQDDALIEEVFKLTAQRKTLAAALVSGAVSFDEIPTAPDDDECFFCPFYRPQSKRDNGPGCPGPGGA